MVYKSNAGRLGSGFISVCSEPRWLDQKGSFYVPERPCNFLKEKIKQCHSLQASIQKK